MIPLLPLVLAATLSACIPDQPYRSRAHWSAPPVLHAPLIHHPPPSWSGFHAGPRPHPHIHRMPHAHPRAFAPPWPGSPPRHHPHRPWRPHPHFWHPGWR